VGSVVHRSGVARVVVSARLQNEYYFLMTDLTGEDVQRFHRWSRTYERSLGQIFLFDPVHKAVVNLVAASLDGLLPACVLDIGCGTGRLLRRAALRKA
jgi:SAM-dependent methyltransferase